jgi:hypothetical protein
MSYTQNVEQINSSIIPALERELAGALAKEDESQAEAIRKEIAYMEKLANSPSDTETQVPETAEKRTRGKAEPAED